MHLIANTSTSGIRSSEAVGKRESEIMLSMETFWHNMITLAVIIGLLYVNMIFP